MISAISSRVKFVIPFMSSILLSKASIFILYSSSLRSKASLNPLSVVRSSMTAKALVLIKPRLPPFDDVPRADPVRSEFGPDYGLYDLADNEPCDYYPDA